MLRDVAVRGAIGSIALFSIVPCASQAAVLTPGFLYRIHNHPNAAIDPPPYGARLDELYDATAGPDDFTFDFDYTSPTFTAAMFLFLAEPVPGRYVIEISGRAWGGRDIGFDYANDQYQGIYQFFFRYTIGAKDAAGDDDIVVDPNDPVDPQGPDNAGWVKTPLGDTFLLGDVSDGNFSFRLGDEDDDAGHSGFNGVSGWGWLEHGLAPPLNDIPLSDWIFTVDTEPVPTPGSAMLLGLAGVAVLRVRARPSRA